MADRSIGYLAGLDFAHQDAHTVAETLASLGYQGVSWPFERFDPHHTTPTDRLKLVAGTRQAGLTVCEWVLQRDFVHPEAAVRQMRLNTALDSLRALAELDMRAPINLFTGPAPWDPQAPRLGRDIAEGLAWEMVRTAFDALVPMAEQLDLDLAVEGVFGHAARDYYTTRYLLDAYDSPHLGINFDPSHGILLGNDIPWAVHQWGSRIKHVHLKDAAGKPGLPGETFLFPMLGEGEVPWAPFFAALDAVNYTGFYTVEFEAFSYYRQVLHNDPAASARLSMAQVRGLLAADLPKEGS